MIDEKKLIEEVKSYFKMLIDKTDDDVDCILDYNKQICNIIESQLNVDKWIPVSERLPENKVNVLISKSNGKVSIGFCNVNYSEWREEGYIISTPLAWKPLPEPYKED
jgi:hypothetical protein